MQILVKVVFEMNRKNLSTVLSAMLLALTVAELVLTLKKWRHERQQELEMFADADEPEATRVGSGKPKFWAWPPLHEWLASFRAFVRDDLEESADDWEEVGATLERTTEPDTASIPLGDAMRPYLSSDIET